MLRNQLFARKKGFLHIYTISHFCSGCKNGGWRNCILQLVESIRPWSFRMYRIWLLDLSSSVFFVNSYFWRIFTQIQTVWICWTLKICADVVRIPFSRDPLLALVSSKSVVVLVDFIDKIIIFQIEYNHKYLQQSPPWGYARADECSPASKTSIFYSHLIFVI